VQRGKNLEKENHTKKNPSQEKAVTTVLFMKDPVRKKLRFESRTRAANHASARSPEKYDTSK